MQALVVLVIVPYLQALPLLQGCEEEKTWLKKLKEHEANVEYHKAKQEGLTLSESPEECKKRIAESMLETDAGWKALKIALSILVM